MKTADLRKKFIDFFKGKKHYVIPSASLIPENDPTTLFTSSGMQAILPYLLGEPHPLGKRLTNSQKCFRAGDIEEVGDNRHTTFFEMLGNWALGDYFKNEQIPWFFEFVTKELGLHPKNLYVSAFRGNEKIGIPKDTESAELWEKEFQSVGIDAKVVDNAERDGMQGGRIFYYDEKKNWWSRAGIPEHMNEGEPGGPDSEMFWDFGEELFIHEKSLWKDKSCHINCDCGRFIEIGNSVFMEYVKKNGRFESLPQKNVDFGGGLERMAVAVMDEPDIFLIDIFDTARKKLEELSGITYTKASEEEKKAFRVILDHLRAATFLITDGATPSNKDQGYVTRRLLRRSVRFAHKLGINKLSSHIIGLSFIEAYKDVYANLNEKKELIENEFVKEEEKFLATLRSGEKYFNKVAESAKTISGKDAFTLYSTYGFPFELTEELAKEAGKTIDNDGFNRELKEHQEISRKGAEQKFKGGLADTSYETTKLHTATHLLHASLRKVLGEHVFQKGSNITKERLRFDFSHLGKLTAEEIKKVEVMVNEVIAKNYTMTREVLTVAEAKKLGAIGLFEDKYAQIGDNVSLYTAKDEKTGEVFSREICGGPHVGKTGELGKFKITKEESVSAGVRRIKAALE